MRRATILPLLGATLLLIHLACAPRSGPEPLRVLAAASLTDVLPPVAEAWEAAGGAPLRIAYDATSRLAAQLKAGAPADVFIAADEAWMDDLEAGGHLAPGSARILLTNTLVFVVPAEGAPAPQAALTLPEGAGPIALAGESVPAGRYARQALDHLRLMDAVGARLVEGESVRTVLRWVAQGEAVGGVVYGTDARAEPRVALRYAFPEESHEPIRYPAALPLHVKDVDGAQAFLTFCAGPGRPIFEAAGFGIPGGAAP